MELPGHSPICISSWRKAPDRGIGYTMRKAALKARVDSQSWRSRHGCTADVLVEQQLLQLGLTGDWGVDLDKQLPLFSFFSYCSCEIRWSATMTASTEIVRVLIVGAGIGGLATAISLSRVAAIPNLDIQLYEQATELLEIGASIALSPNVRHPRTKYHAV